MAYEFGRYQPSLKEFQECHSPLISTEPIPTCPVCGSPENELYAEGIDYELLTCSNLWKFVSCTNCRHVWLNPRPAVAELPVIYPLSYYAYNYKAINFVARNAKALLDRRKMSAILRALHSAPRTYLDIGCGDGRFLGLMEKIGIPKSKLYGLELDQSVVSRLNAEGYGGVSCARVEEATKIPENAIDLVTMFHVIEHVDDPAAVVRRICGWLSPGGILALETPNLDSLDAHLFRRTYWGGYHFPRHWNLFSPATIQRLLASCGLEVVGTTFQTGHSFWMYSLHHAIRYEGNSRPRLGKMFDPVHSLLGIAGFTAFDLLRGKLGAKTSAMLVIARKN